MSETIIGIDLGSTNSCVCVIEGGQPVVIINSEGKRTTPSIVSFKDNDRKIGDPAKRQMSVNPNTVFSIKRLIGKKYDDLDKNHLSTLPYKVVKGDGGNCLVEIEGKKYTPQEISAMILQKMKKTAEDYLGKSIKKAVITVPAYFNDSERTATKEAGEIAGLEVLRIINEPTAASLAYGDDKKGDKKIAVFDLGGSTFDISILEIGDGVYEVKSTNGDIFLGGDVFDEEIINWIVEEFKKDYPTIDLKKDQLALQRLREAAEKTKIELSSSSSSDINLPYITVVDNIPTHFNKSLTRSQFEKLIDKYIQKLITPCEKAIKDSGIDVSEIDEVLLVGGSTRIPIVQETVKKIFGKEPNKSINPDESVAVGAAIQGAVLTGSINDILLLDVIPLTIGIETMGGVMTRMIESNTTIPVSKAETFSTASDNQPSVEVHILQGERPMVKDNKTLGRFHLEGIMSSPRGVPQIEIQFSINANGILEVSAKDKATGKVNSIRVEGSSNLNKDEIEKMKEEAKQNEQNDKKEKELIDKLNSADSLIFSTEKQIKEFGDKLSDSQKTELSDVVSKLKVAHASKNIEDVDKLTTELTEKWHTISQNLYQPNSEQKTENKEEVKDVNFDEVK